MCCVDGDCLSSPSKGRSSVLPLVPRLAGVLPPLQLCVWKGQRGQHGDGKEGRLCPARPPGRPEGKGAWRALEQRKRVSGKKETFSLLLLFFLCVVFMCRASGLPVPPSPSELCDSRNPSLISLYFCHLFRFVSASFLSLSGEKLTNWVAGAKWENSCVCSLLIPGQRIRNGSQRYYS